MIDLGCLPDTPFPHLEEAIGALKEHGYKSSVDSADPDELLRGGKAGADYLLSLNEETLHIADQVASTPVLIPKDHGDMASLYRAMDALDKKGRAYLADPVLDPINFGFMTSLERYAELRRERPRCEILLGTGNLTELTDADTTGTTAMLLGIASELRIRNVLVVQVSPHTRRTYEEHDIARRMMFASRADAELPKGYTDELLCLHARRPFPLTPEEIADARNGGARQEFPHRDRRGRHPHLQSRRASRGAGCLRAVCQARRRRGRALTPSISAPSSLAPRSPGGLGSATLRTSRSPGAWPPTHRPTTGRD